MARERAKAEAAGVAAGPSWPGWTKWLISAAIIYQMLAVVAAGLSAPPSSPLERMIADKFVHYYELTDQGHAYRYYAPEPPPTPVVIARLSFADGRPDEEVRLPDRSLRPRLRYQRHLALANHLYVEFDAARSSEGDQRASRWAESYARHLCRTQKCARVTMYARFHLIPDLQQLHEAQSTRAERRSTSTPTSSTPLPNGLENSRATSSERPGRLSGRAGRGGRSRWDASSSSRPTRRPWA